MRPKRSFLKSSQFLNVLLSLLGFYSIQASATNLPIGVGPVKEVKLETLDTVMATKGKEIFVAKCSACHKMEERYVGPALKGVTTRRNPAWIMNMILNPQEMLQADPTAQSLLEEFLVPMTFQNVSEPESRSLLEYFRHFDEKGEIVAGGAAKAAKQPKPKK